jgi:hypothetical protein
LVNGSSGFTRKTVQERPNTTFALIRTLPFINNNHHHLHDHININNNHHHRYHRSPRKKTHLNYTDLMMTTMTHKMTPAIVTRQLTTVTLSMTFTLMKTNGVFSHLITRFVALQVPSQFLEMHTVLQLMFLKRSPHKRPYDISKAFVTLVS